MASENLKDLLNQTIASEIDKENAINLYKDIIKVANDQ